MKAYVAIRKIDYVEDVIAVFLDAEVAANWMDFHTANPEFLAEYGSNLSMVRMKEIEVMESFEEKRLIEAKNTIEKLTVEFKKLDSQIKFAKEELKKLVKSNIR
jgi:hypothetical protein